MASSDSEVRALLDRRIEACQAKDIDRLMSLYSPNIVYYDVVPPLQFVGSGEVRRNFLRWFDEYDGPISLETHHLKVMASADVAFAHMLHLDSGTRKNGPDGAAWVRSTVCCRRAGGQWQITHEHISMPGTPALARATSADRARLRHPRPGGVPEHEQAAAHCPGAACCFLVAHACPRLGFGPRRSRTSS